MKQWKSILAVMLGIFLMAGCVSPSEKEQKRYTATFLDVFDTRTEIAGYAESEEAFLEQAEQIKERLWYYHRLYDIYNSYEGIHNIKTINDNAGIAPVKVDQEIIDLLKLSREMYDLSEGKVNITMGSLLSIWHDYREYGSNYPAYAEIPEMALLQEAAEQGDFDDLVIDEEASTVYIADPEMSLDVGGIGKGYAVQRAADYAREMGIERMLISVGGNVAAIGGKAGGESWKIGITDPNEESGNTYAAKVNVKDCCIVTSGNYQRYYVVDDKKYCHIVDPDTLMPADHFASVTIITEDSGVADALSTAVFTLPLEEGMAFVNGMDGVEAMWIEEDGTIWYSDQFKDAYLAQS